jgi:hypothetical protein
MPFSDAPHEGFASWTMGSDRTAAATLARSRCSPGR